jgi:hypothetical protein
MIQRRSSPVNGRVELLALDGLALTVAGALCCFGALDEREGPVPLDGRGLVDGVVAGVVLTGGVWL